MKSRLSRSIQRLCSPCVDDRLRRWLRMLREGFADDLADVRGRGDGFADDRQRTLLRRELDAGAMDMGEGVARPVDMTMATQMPGYAHGYAYGHAAGYTDGLAEPMDDGADDMEKGDAEAMEKVDAEAMENGDAEPMEKSGADAMEEVDAEAMENGDTEPMEKSGADAMEEEGDADAVDMEKGDADAMEEPTGEPESFQPHVGIDGFYRCSFLVQN